MMISLSMVFRLIGALWLVAAAAGQPAGDILVLGDSLSAAYGMDTALGWVERLRGRLRQQGLANGVVNASISGETTAGGLSRLDELLARHRPGIVVVELGGNDGLRGLPLPEVRSNLSHIIESSLAQGAKVVLIPIALPTNYGRLYNEGLRAIYHELSTRYGVSLSPFILQGVADRPERMQDDGIHPKAEAQEAMLDNVWPALLPLL
jgi:acyl-CoA thioesterase-1